jgi:leucyl aminopeptidase
MLAKLVQIAKPLDDAALAKSLHALVVLPLAKKLESIAGVPQRERLAAVLKRRDMKAEELVKSPVAVHLEHGGLCVFVMMDAAKTRFERYTVLRKAIALLLEEQPRELAIGVLGNDRERAEFVRQALYVTWANGLRLPVRKKKDGGKPLQSLRLHAPVAAAEAQRVAAVARGNFLARELTALPPNELTPARYRERLRRLARARGWRCEEYDMKRLRRMGAGAFVAVAQGSADQDAAVVHLSYRPRGARGRIALVGKGICFDTGGHNLKPAKYMHGMHEDMNGSAVALGLMQALAECAAPVAVDTWLAIAQNHISPQAYKQNDIVMALDGTTIEVVHTDAEGRMVLADTLTLAARGAGAPPDLIVDFATLTGSMIYALGSRYAGVFASSAELTRLAVAAGEASGERVCPFPLDADYEAALESKVADIKQCTLEGEADHILAARFLKRFTGERPWLHVDLSAANCSGGLGAIGSDITGFGVAWGMELVEQWSAVNLPLAARSRRRAA